MCKLTNTKNNTMKKKKMLKKTKAKDLVKTDTQKLNELTILFEEFNRIYNDNFFLNNYNTKNK